MYTKPSSDRYEDIKDAIAKMSAGTRFLLRDLTYVGVLGPTVCRDLHMLGIRIVGDDSTGVHVYEKY
ncbi:hypothetical protein SAMN04487760_10550 [Lachnospiraceae bacterium G41]|nr:hypothetical protein SAMN04487760_10550 [Lachnospiraceae bacterium G41]